MGTLVRGGLQRKEMRYPYRNTSTTQGSAPLSLQACQWRDRQPPNRVRQGDGSYFWKPEGPASSFGRPICSEVGRIPHSVVFASGEDSACTPLANEGVGLGPSSSSGPVASRPPLAERSASAASQRFISPGRFMRWSYTCDGSLAALPEVRLLGNGCGRMIRVPQILCLTPPPCMRSRLLFLALRYGRCSRRRPFHIAWNPPLRWARDCPSLPLWVAALSLKLSDSEVPGSHVLLSSYVARVFSCGPGVLFSFVTLPGLSLWFFRTCLGLCRDPLDIRNAFF